MNKKIIINENQLNNIITPLYKKYAIIEKVISLVESRGMFKDYDSVINLIITYCDTYIKQNNPDKKIKVSKGNNIAVNLNLYKINIPIDILNKISWANNKEIIINVSDMNEEDLNKLGEKDIIDNRNAGYSNLSFDKIDANGKLSKLSIFLYVFSLNKKIYYQNLHSSLYHELTHAFENYSRLKKNNNGLFTILNNTNYFDIINSDSNDPNLMSFNEINYRLLINTELNALIASTYGDLQRINSVRNNFSRDIKQTDAYKIYDSIKNHILPSIIKLDANYWKIFKSKTYLQKNKTISINNFKKEFIKSVDFKLNELIKGIGKVASQYYDDIEMKNNMLKTKIIQP
jgi:hypothetical protein